MYLELGKFFIIFLPVDGRVTGGENLKPNDPLSLAPPINEGGEFLKIFLKNLLNSN